MSPVLARATSRFAGRRLSLGRLLLSLTAFVVVSAGATAAAVLPQLTPPVAGAARRGRARPGSPCP